MSHSSLLISKIQDNNGPLCPKIKKVLLINPVLIENQPPRIISFGIAYIVQQLISFGYDVGILDIDANRYSKEEVLRRIEMSSCDIVGIGSLVTAYKYLSWLIPEIRKLKPNIKIILGGGIATALPARCIERFGVDYVVIGEGEITIIDLLRTLNENRDIHEVDGIAFKDNGKVEFTKPRQLMPSLEDVPPFNTDLFPIEKLLKNNSNDIQIHVQRGCPSFCTFCFNCFRITSNKVRYRPVENVIEEIESVRRRFPIRYFYLSGECVTMNKGWILTFCRELVERKMKIKYRVTSRLDTIDEERLEWLKRSGCSILSFGLESGSPDILKIMKKHINLEKAKKILKLAERYIPKMEVSIMYGYIGESRETIRETTEYCKKLGILPTCFFATAYPGTELWKMAVEQGYIKDEEEAMMNLSNINEFSVNLTEIPNNELLRLKRESEYEIMKHYFVKHPGKLFKKFFVAFKHKELKNTYLKAKSYLLGK